MIPIQNLYYLLSYAWQSLPWGKWQIQGAEQVQHPVDLLAQVFASALAKLQLEDIPLDYQEITQEAASPKGRLLFSQMLKAGKAPKGKLLCAYPELVEDPQMLQILKTVLSRLLQNPDLDGELQTQLLPFAQPWKDIKPIHLNPAVFAQARERLPLPFIQNLLSLCELLAQQLLPTQGGQYYRFQALEENELALARIFEAFVRNFFTREQAQYHVSRPWIRWADTQAQDAASQQALPLMQTDMVLRSPQKVILIDTKFTRQNLKLRFGKERIQSAHLYQLYAYLQNYPREAGQELEGILLYPVLDKAFELRYEMQGREIRVMTVDVGGESVAIREGLLRMLG